MKGSSKQRRSLKRAGGWCKSEGTVAELTLERQRGGVLSGIYRLALGRR